MLDQRQVTGTRPPPCNPIARDKHVTRARPASSHSADTFTAPKGVQHYTSSTVVHHIAQLTLVVLVQSLALVPPQPVSPCTTSSLALFLPPPRVCSYIWILLSPTNLTIHKTTPLCLSI